MNVKMKVKIPFFILLSIFLFSCSHTFHSNSNVTYLGDSNYFGVSKVQRYRLANGLKILVLEDHSAPTFAYQTWYNVGSRDERPGLTGLAHLFEHMMFKATKDHPDGEFSRILELAGAEGENAFTSHDYTGYVQNLPSGNFDLIASLESSRMTKLIVDDHVLDVEREVVKNERRFRNDNNPDGLLQEKLYETAFLKHSYHWPVIGYEPDLRATKEKQCNDFYRGHYAPNNATIVIVGDVNAAKVIRILDKYYGSIPSTSLLTNIPSLEPPQKHERIAHVPIKSPIEKLLVGYHVPNIRHEDGPALQVLQNLLSGGKSSTLHHKLVDGGIATEVEAEFFENKDPGLFVIGADMQKGRTAKQALYTIDSVLRQLRAGHIANDEIERAIAYYRLSLFGEQVSNASKARFLGFYETVAGDYKFGIELVESLKAIDKTKLAKVIDRYLSKQNRTVIFGTVAKAQP